MPNQHGVDGANAILGLTQKSAYGEFPFFWIVETTVPYEQLDLGKNVLRPLQFGALELQAIVAEQSTPFGSPGFDPLQPCRGICRILRPGEKDFTGGGQ